MLKTDIYVLQKRAKPKAEMDKDAFVEIFCQTVQRNNIAREEKKKHNEIDWENIDINSLFKKKWTHHV